MNNLKLLIFSTLFGLVCYCSLIWFDLLGFKYIIYSIKFFSFALSFGLSYLLSSFVFDKFEYSKNRLVKLLQILILLIIYLIFINFILKYLGFDLFNPILCEGVDSDSESGSGSTNTNNNTNTPTL